jgi:hypothetical protein
MLVIFRFVTFAFETFRKNSLKNQHIHAFAMEGVDVDGDLRRQFVSIRLSMKVNSGRYFICGQGNALAHWCPQIKSID